MFLQIEDLKPGGTNIPVTAENRIEYIHLVADYKLNRYVIKMVNTTDDGSAVVFTTLELA